GGRLVGKPRGGRDPRRRGRLVHQLVDAAFRRRLGERLLRDRLLRGGLFLAQRRLRRLGERVAQRGPVLRGRLPGARRRQWVLAPARLAHLDLDGPLARRRGDRLARPRARSRGGRDGCVDHVAEEVFGGEQVVVGGTVLVLGPWCARLVVAAGRHRR